MSKQENNPTEKERKVAEKKKLTLMKKGDYTVHVLIEELKNIEQKTKEYLPSPVVKISCLGKEYRTAKPPEDCTEETINEHFYFESTDLTIVELDSAKIIIEVYDYKNYKTKKDYFGIYEFDFGYIYNQPNHSLQNIWLALANPESEEMSKIRGSLKLSISVLHEEDPIIALHPNDRSDSNFVLPSQISSECKQVTFNIFRAEGVPDMDSSEFSCDGYIKLTYMGLQKQTQIVKMNEQRTIIWNEAIDLPVNVPVVSSKILFTMFDYDTLGKDDIVGSFEIDVNEIINGKYKNYHHFHIYGSYENKNDSLSKKMNLNPEYGSKWKGKVLMKIDCKSIESPSLKVRSISDENLIRESINIKPEECWNLYFNLFAGYYLPTDYSKLKIRVSIEDKNIDFKEVKSKKGHIEWNQFLETKIFTFVQCEEELPDIFVYLLSGDTPVCIQRLSASSLLNNKDIMIIKLIPEPVLKKVDRLYKSGIIKIRATIFNQDLCNKNNVSLDFLDDYNQSNNLIGKDDEDDLEDAYANAGLHRIEDDCNEYHKLITIVHMTRGLISKDPNGKNDPYVKIQIYDESNEQKTDYNSDTVNGIWHQKLEFESISFDKNKKSTWPVLRVLVYDHDTCSKDDIIAYSYIMLSDVSLNWNRIKFIEPLWFPLYLPKSNKPQGEILLTFYIFDAESYSNTLSEKIVSVPETSLYSFEINVLGLRSLKPLSLFPVKKAYIKFDMNSLNIKGGNNSYFKPILTEPKSAGSNPNITTVIKFDLELPTNKIFIPQLQCEVYDSILSGMVNPLLGVFMLDIEQIVKKTGRDIIQDLRIVRKKMDNISDKFFNKIKIKRRGRGFNFERRGRRAARMREDPSSQQMSNIREEHKNQEVANMNNNGCEIKIERKDEKVEPLIGSDAPAYGESREMNPISLKNEENDTSLEDINSNKNDPEYFVIFPSFKKFHIPGIKKGEKFYEEFDVEDEDAIPNDQDYYPLGYIKKKEIAPSALVSDKIEEDPETDKINKHYRRIYRNELEKVFELKTQKPFQVENITRGEDEEIVDENALFECVINNDYKILKKYKNENNTRTPEKAESETSSKRGRFVLRAKRVGETKETIKKKKDAIKNNSCGLFKGIIRVCQKEYMTEYYNIINEFKDKNPQLISELKNINKYEDLTRRLLTPTKVLVRLYVLELNQLEKKDKFSDSDPYIKILINGEVKVNEVENHHENQKNCKWFKCYDINAEFPGDSVMDIEVWDYNSIFSDELIGRTSIDLEDRYYNEDWRELKNKPIEMRNIYHPDIMTKQGYIYLWLEVFEKTDKATMEPWMIQPEPATKLQMRLIIYETEGIECADVEDTSDIFISAYVNPLNAQNTDCHYRCQNGNASFNWRMVLDLSLPEDNRNLIINAYDRDLFKRNDYLGGASLNIRGLLKIVKDINVPISFTKDYVNELDENEKANYPKEFIEFDDSDETGKKFWIRLDNQGASAGRVLCALEVVPIWKANLSKVGLGRDEPNVTPYLPPPVGRLHFTLNPFSMINQCVGPKFRKKMYLICCAICCGAYLICFLPYIILHLTGELVNPFNYFK